MKTKLLIAFLVVINYSGYSQLDLIDKIAGTLIPTVFNGIKDIKSDGNKKEKTEKAKDLESQMRLATSGVVIKIDDDIANLKAINGLFSLTSRMTDELGALRGLTGEEFLSNVILVNKEDLYVHTGLRIDDALSELVLINAELKKFADIASDPNLSSRIDRSVADLKSRLNKLLRRTRLSSPLTTETPLRKAADYIKNLNIDDTRIDIRDMSNSVNDINVEMSSWVRSNISALKQTKEKLKASLE